MMTLSLDTRKNGFHNPQKVMKQTRKEMSSFEPELSTNWNISSASPT